MSSNNAGADPVVWGTIGLTAVVLLAVFQISRSIGADFQATLSAFMPSLLIVVGAGFARWKLPLPSLPVASLALVVIWPFWWPVIDSIANPGAASDRFYLNLRDDVWWSTTTFKWCVEVGLIAVFGATLLRHRNNYY